MKSIKWALALVIVLLAFMVLTIGGVGVSLLLENQNSFCASCHTEPEVKYYQQSVQANVTTLVTFHVQKQTNCIDCHSGGGPLGDVLRDWSRESTTSCSSCPKLQAARHYFESVGG